MKKTFIGNDDAYHQLSGYISLKNPGPLILYGKTGLGKRRAAEAAACAILECCQKDLGHNGDFFLLDRKGNPIKVEDILSLLDKSSLAALGSCKVYQTSSELATKIAGGQKPDKSGDSAQ